MRLKKDDFPKTVKVDLTDVFVVGKLSDPKVLDNLILVDALSKKGINCNFTKHKLYLIDTNDKHQKIGFGEVRSDGVQYLAFYSARRSGSVD